MGFLLQSIYLPAVKQVVEEAGSAPNLLNQVKDQFEKARGKEFKVAVAAMMKCGKSTLLDCLVQESILPEDVLPETSAIVSILHDSGISQPELFVQGQSTTLARGSIEIFNFIKDLNRWLREKGQTLGKGSVDNPRNFQENMTKLCLKTNVPCLSNLGNDITFLLLDTAGYNEANAAIVQATEQLLYEADVIIYLLDITKLGQTDEANFLKTMIAKRSDLLKEERAYFLLNKADVVPKTKRINKVNEAKTRVRGFLEKIDLSLVAVLDQTTFHLSTQDYLLNFLASNGKYMCDEQIEKLNEILFGMDAEDPTSLPDITDPDVRKKMDNKIVDSNYKYVEDHVIQSLTIKAPRLFAIAVVQNLLRICCEVLENVSTRLSIVKQGKNSAEDTVTALANAVGSMETLKNNIKSKIKEFAFEFQDRQKFRSDELQSKLLQEIRELTQNAQVQHTTQESAEAMKQQYYTRIGNIITDQVSLTKVKTDHELEKIVNNCSDACRRAAYDAVNQTILQILEKFLPRDVYNEKRQELQQFPSISRQSSGEFRLAQLDFSSMKSGALGTVEVTTTEKEAYLVPAEYETVVEKVGGDTVNGYVEGAKVGSYFPPGIRWMAMGVGAIVGGCIYGIKETTTLIEKTVVKKEAELKYKDIEKKTQCYVVNFDELEKEILEIVKNSVVKEFNNSFVTIGNIAFNKIEEEINAHYFQRIHVLTSQLQSDIDASSHSAEEATATIQKLENTLIIAKKLKHQLELPIEEIMSDNSLTFSLN